MVKPKASARRTASPAQGGSLAFVHLTHPDDLRDRELQTGIRRHVMRDIGHSRRKRPRHRVIPLEVAAPEENRNVARVQREAGKKTPFRVLSSIRFTGNYPVEPDRRALELLHFMQSEMDHKYRPFRFVWLRTAIIDAATFNLSLAHGVVFLNELRRRAGFDFMYDEESVKYLSRALKQLSFYLEDESARVGEGAVCTILGLACKDANTGNWNQWSTHMDGLEQIYRLRGGFHGMGHDLPILAVWLDLLGATVFDMKPRFALPVELDQDALVNDGLNPPKLATLLQKLEKASVEFIPVAEALAHMSMVSTTINSNSTQPLFWKADVAAVRIIGPAAHHLLSMSRLPQDHPPSQVALATELMRLACLILLAAVKARFSLPASEIFNLHDRYCSLLRQDITWFADEILELVLWTAVTVAVMSPSEERGDIITHIRTIMTLLNLKTGFDAVHLAQEVVWINDLMSGGTASLSHEIHSFLPQGLI